MIFVMIITIITAHLLGAFNNVIHAFMNRALYFHNLAIVSIKVESNNNKFVRESTVVVRLLNTLMNTKEPQAVLKNSAVSTRTFYQ